MITFLYRYSGSPAAQGGHPFTDVPEDVYYAAAVAWAYNLGITDGKTDALFGPDDPCVRAQAVSFIYRMVAEEKAA